MEVVATINRAKCDASKWRYKLSIPKKLILAFGMAGLTRLLAQVRFYLPWSPVPITGQTFAVLLAGILLGRWWGGLTPKRAYNGEVDKDKWAKWRPPLVVTYQRPLE